LPSHSVAEQDAERVLDLFLVGATTDVAEVRRLPAGVNSMMSMVAMARPAPFTMHAIDRPA